MLLLTLTLTLCPRMLYDFHEKQNAKKPRSVHATYLIIGTTNYDSDDEDLNGDAEAGAESGAESDDTETLEPDPSLDDGDSIMRSSPFPSSGAEPDAPRDFDGEESDEVMELDVDLDEGSDEGEYDPDRDEPDSEEDEIPTTTVMMVKEEDLESTFCGVTGLS